MTYTDVLAPIQQAIYTLLAGDATLMGRIAGVHDHVTEGTAFPYVVLGEVVETPQGAHDRYGSRTVVTLHIWSDYHGWKEALQIKGDLMRLLDHQTLTVAGHDFVRCHHEQTVTLRDPDADLRHVACRFALETEHPA